MKKTIFTITFAAITFSCTASANKMPDPYTEAGPAIEARQGVHRLMGATLMDAGAIATGQKKWNGFTMLNRVDALAQISQMYNDFFFVQGSLEPSNAVNDLHQRKTEFQTLSRNLQIATNGLRMAVRNHDGPVAMKAVVKTIKACNSCHQSFMKPSAKLILPLPPAGAGAAH